MVHAPCYVGGVTPYRDGSIARRRVGTGNQSRAAGRDRYQRSNAPSLVCETKAAQRTTHDRISNPYPGVSHVVCH
jgi:hypothetical protein